MKHTPVHVTPASVYVLRYQVPLAHAISPVLRAIAKRVSKRAATWYAKRAPRKSRYTRARSLSKSSVDAEIRALLQDDDLDALAAALVNKLAPMYQVGMDQTMRETTQAVKISFEAVNPRATMYAEARAAQLVGKRILSDGTIIENPNATWAISETLRAELRQTIDRAIKEGPTPQQLAAQIRAMSGFSQARALMIARTELAFAYQAGQLDQARNLKYQSKYSLLGDLHKVPDECDDNAKEGVIPIHQHFVSGDLTSPFHPNCVCDVIYQRTNAPNQPVPQGPADVGRTAADVTNQEVRREILDAQQPPAPSLPGEVSESVLESSIDRLRRVQDEAKWLTQRERTKLANDLIDKMSGFDTLKWKDVAEAVRGYTGLDYRTINPVLRGHLDSALGEMNLRDSGLVVNDAINLLRTATHLQEIADPVKGVRVLQTPVGPSTRTVLDNYIDHPSELTNNPLMLGDHGFGSVSLDQEWRGFTTFMEGEMRLRLIVTLPKGTRGVYVTSLSEHPEEQEFLLPDGMVMRVTAVTKTSREYLVDCILLPQSDISSLDQATVYRDLVKARLDTSRDQSLFFASALKIQ